MTEPLNPAAVGVASALKSLRTRAGLREDRLHGTELALDTLAGLDSVRERTKRGEIGRTGDRGGGPGRSARA